ncbi:MAG: translation initiation factor IF-2, partial [Thermoplasmata archaeon]|nr:translation initiation factor IF-2 [Thermoplasmata archaeon]
AIAGQEVALALEGVTVGRQVKPEDILYVDIPANNVKDLRCIELSHDENEVLDAVIRIKRKEDPYWGM